MDALRNYLLLTCFDVLGARSEHLDFQSWLRARRTAQVRDAAIAALPAGAAAAHIAATLHRKYLDEFGATQAFYRLLREVLPADDRSALLFSVRVREIDIEKNLEVRAIDDSNVKEDFLFEVRNKFTHEARDVGSPAGGVFTDWGKAVLIEGVPQMGWEPIHHAYSGNTRVEHAVRDWPTALINAVRAGIATLRSSMTGV